MQAANVTPVVGTDPISLPSRFAKIKADLIRGHEADIIASWNRLLECLRREIDQIVSASADLIPTIDFKDIGKPSQVQEFSQDLRKRGVAVVRNVVDQDEVFGWQREAEEYLDMNPHTRGHPPQDPRLYEMYWGPAQVKARAHPNVFAAQKFVMGLWNASIPEAPISAAFPITYADRISIRRPGDDSPSQHVHVDGGSVERWEPDGYGVAGTYAKIFQGKWEEYDPWDSSTRLLVSSDLYNRAGTCSTFRMFQGWLALSNVASGEGILLACPLLQLTTAYFLLRPFFSPRASFDGGREFLDASNWALENPQGSVLHGALPSYTQEINSIFHPHLQLDRSLVPIPAVNPGDYVFWHPDTVHAADRAVADHTRPVAYVHIPACPLTQTNALFLARQRKAFLLGYPAPDFEGGKGESNHMGRAGVQEVNDTGGEQALRSMGLLPFDEEEADTDAERELLALANAILFPDRFDMI